HTFTRGQMGLGAASAMLMLGAVLAIIVPYLYSELRNSAMTKPEDCHTAAITRQ
ncbi:hypothetical protein R0G64_31675, partial [Pseudomonas otitidis]|nr:hypothetical protein [Pseudomonas otitidis]